MFGEIRCEADLVPYCCGHLLIYNLEAGPTVNIYKSVRRAPVVFKTQKEQYDAFVKKIDTILKKDTTSWNHDEVVQKLDCCYGLISMTLVPDYWPGLVERLTEEEGWSKAAAATNPKTGNKLVMIVKELN